MRKIDVEAYPDTSLPDLGRVVVLLRGIKSLARVPVLRLRPADRSMLDEAVWQWPEGDLLPSETRACSEGLELVIGADIAESPGLMPGVAVEIELPELRLGGEFLWPSVAPAARPRRRSIVARKGAVPPRPQHAVTASEARSGPAILAINAGPPPPRETSASRAAAPGPEPIKHEPFRNMALRQEPFRPDTTISTNRSGVQPTGHAVSAPPSAPYVHAASPAANLDREILHTDAEWEDILRAEQAAHSADVTWRPQHPASPAAHSKPASTQAASTQAASAQAPSAKAPSAMAGGFVSQAINSGFDRLSAHGRAGLIGFIIGTVLAIEALSFAVRGYLPTSAGADPASSKVAWSVASSGDFRLIDTLQTGPASPRGVVATETNPEKLLALANGSLHAPGSARDVDEGAFWLKRYVAAALGDERMLRVLTQLGSTYAEPASGTPDFVKARQLWEFASTFGDPVAMCFLGALSEHGLGVTAEKKAALHWYARAKSAGGCPHLEESIARVMP